MSDTAPEPRRGRPFSFWLAIILFLLLGFSMLMNLGLLALAGIGADGANAAGLSKPFSESVIESGGDRRIVVIDVQGQISDERKDSIFGEGQSLVDRVSAQLRQVRDDAKVCAVVLAVDSPGGGVTASDVLHDEVLRTKKAGKKVVVHMGDLCASGGYYLSAPADHIIASPTSITGSIGVIMVPIDAHKLVEDKLGLAINPIKSGKYKDMMSPLRSLRDDERALLQGMVDRMYDRFVDIVTDGRQGHGPFGVDRDAVEQAVRALADGRIYTGDQAVDNGLADAVGYLHDAIASAKELSGVGNATVVRYRRERGLFGLMEASAKGINVNAGVQVDAAGLTAALTPRLEYRWSPSGL